MKKGKSICEVTILPSRPHPFSNPIFISDHTPLLASLSLSALVFILMDPQRRQGPSVPERKGQKRKLDEETVIGDEQQQQQQQQQQREISSSSAGTSSSDARQALLCEVSAQVNVLTTTFSWLEADRAAAKRATHVLAELAKNGPCLPILPLDLELFTPLSLIF